MDYLTVDTGMAKSNTKRNAQTSSSQKATSEFDQQKMQLDQEFKKKTTGHINVNNLVNKSNVKDFKKFENENGSIKEETIEEDDEEQMANTQNRLKKKKILSPPLINSVRNSNMQISNRTDTDPRYHNNRIYDDLQISLLNAQKTVAKFEIQGKKKSKN